MSTPAGIITPTQITTLTKNYDSRYQAIIDKIFGGVPDSDNRSSWYSLQDLKDFLEYAESQAESNEYVLDGIRIYPGSHEEGDKGLATFLLVPTGYKNGEDPSTGKKDLTDCNGLDQGEEGIPPGANYPQ